MSEAERKVASGWISFDRVEIDLAGRRLFVDAVAIPLEPKAFGVLALLAQHPGRVFTRDEILDAVWGHRHVTPGVLNRVVTLLRHALGETAEHTRHLSTVHAVGYRFDAPVRFSVERESAQAAGAATPIENVEPVEPPATAAALESPAAIAEPSSAPAAPTHEAERAGAKPRRTMPPGFWLVACAGVALISAAILWPRAKPVAQTSPVAASSTAPTLVVLPLRVVDNADKETPFAEGLSEELTTRLAHIEGLSLISQTSATIAQERNLDLDQLARQLHVSHAIEGSLREAGDQLRIDLRLIEVPSGKTVWAQDYDRKLADVFAIQRDVAQAVAAALALRLGLAGDAQNGESADDVALYREYLELRGVLLKSEFTPGQPRRNAAREALRAFVARAPDYARGHGLLARIFNLFQGPGVPLTPAQIEEATQEASRALQLDPDNADAHDALAELACSRMDWDTCMTEYRRTLALDPTDISARAGGGYAYRLAGIGYLDAASREFESAHRSDPLNLSVAWTRARLLDTMGRHEEALDAFETNNKLDVGLPRASIYGRWYNAVWRHDYAKVRDLAAQMPEEDGFRESYVAISAALQDSSLWPQALKLVDESEQRTGRYNFARLLGPGYDAKRMFAVFAAMLRNAYPSYFLLVWQPEYAALRRDPEFRNYIRDTHMLDYWRARGFPSQCRPEGDGARCD